MDTNTESTQSASSKSSSQSNSNVAPAVAYVIGPIYLLIEKKDKLIRFNALQATFLGIGYFIVNLILSAIGMGLLTSLLGLGALVLWIYLILQALKGQKVVLPVVGEWATKYA